MVEHGRHHTARSAGGRRDNDPARGILLGGSQRISVDLGPRGERIGVAFRLDVVGCRLAGHLQTARQHAVVVQTAVDRLAHRGPDRVEVVPDFGTFAIVDILPIGLTLAVAPRLDLGNRRHGVDALRGFEARGFVGQGSAADAEDRPRIDHLAPLEPFEEHAVGVERKDYVGFPDDLGRSHRFEHRADGHIRQVALARGGQ